MIYSLTSQEREKLAEGLRAAFAIPYIDDIEDFIWEAIFAHVKSIPLVDPLTETRSKKLFDLVDQNSSIGWSAKALQWAFKPLGEFELVIQRADIFKKAEELGFEKLTKESPPADLGKALLRHWYGKVEQDMKTQKVKDARICLLIKSSDRKKFVYVEEPISDYKEKDLIWKWTDSTNTGLQGTRKKDGFCIFRWYPNQKQLFERFKLTADPDIVTIEPRRLPLEEITKFLIDRLGSTS